MQSNRDRADIEEAHMIPSFRKPRRRRLAFTVVELLVVVAIIGVLVSILLPAVGAVRDSARRTQNGNNLRNIGQAVLAYEENKGTYPPLLKRSKNFPNELTKSVSWAFEILPFIEQDAIHSRFDPDQEYDTPANRIAIGTPIELYANPRARDARATAPTMKSPGPSGYAATLDYAANGGTVVDDNRQPVALSVSRPSASNLYPYDRPFDPKFSGPFHASQAISSAAVRDGISNTLCAGDRWIGPVVPGAPLINDLGGMPGDSFFTTVRFANADQSRSPFPTSKTDTSVYKFGSPRGSDACFVFLDGRIQWIPYDVDLVIFQALASINDNYPIGSDWK